MSVSSKFKRQWLAPSEYSLDVVVPGVPANFSGKPKYSGRRSHSTLLIIINMKIEVKERSRNWGREAWSERVS